MVGELWFLNVTSCHGKTLFQFELQQDEMLGASHSLSFSKQKSVLHCFSECLCLGEWIRNMELNDLRKTICLRKSEVYVKKKKQKKPSF